MIEVIQDTTSKYGPWLAEFGTYELVDDGILTADESQILDDSSGEYEVLKCKLKNIDFTKLQYGSKFLKVKRSNGNIETWSYGGQSRIIPEENFSFFTRPI